MYGVLAASSAAIVFFSNSDCDIARSASNIAREFLAHPRPEIAGVGRAEKAAFPGRIVPSPWLDAAPASFGAMRAGKWSDWHSTSGPYPGIVSEDRRRIAHLPRRGMTVPSPNNTRSLPGRYCT
jgi:hypothetical protein